MTYAATSVTRAHDIPPQRSAAPAIVDPFIALACDYTRAQLALIGLARGLTPTQQLMPLAELATTAMPYASAQSELALLAELIAHHTQRPQSAIARRHGELAARLELSTDERVLVAALFVIDAGLVLNRHLAATPLADGRLDAAAATLLASRDPRCPDPHLAAALRHDAVLGRSHVVVFDGPPTMASSHRGIRLADDIVDWLHTGQLPRTGLALAITPSVAASARPDLPTATAQITNDAAALAATWRTAGLTVANGAGETQREVLARASAIAEKTLIELRLHPSAAVLLREQWAAASRFAATTASVVVVHVEPGGMPDDGNHRDDGAAWLGPLLDQLAPHLTVLIIAPQVPPWLAHLPHGRFSFSQLTPKFFGLATRIDHTPSWDGAVFDDDTRQLLQDVIDACRFQAQLLGRWGFAAKLPYGQAVSALLAGPPGTGKTMSAALIARDLGRPLYRVDLACIVSKYIGETEKQLARLFDEAEATGAILLFDEADALFAKRTDVKSSNDRHANLEVNFLLQRLETFGGVILLTTNHEHLLDAAFKRRLRYRIAFAAPDASERRRLWERLIPATADLAPDVDLATLAVRFPLSGGHMLNALVRAACRALASGSAITHALLVESCHLEHAASGRV